MKNILISLAFGVSALTSCKKDDSFFASQGNVYIAGSSNINDSTSVISYWKNSVKTDITTARNGGASGIGVIGDNIYVSYNDNRRAYYWKNGISNLLPHTGEKCITIDLVVSGNDVYILGQDDRRYCYWKNGVQYLLPDNDNLRLYSIAVSGNDVYIGGKESVSSKILEQAITLKNGGLTRLSSDQSIVQYITTSGSDLYACGYDSRMPLDTSSFATYWKNGVKTSLPGGVTFGICSALAVSGNDVYAAGNTETNACYWKNGKLTTLRKNFIPDGIAVSGSDVYISGFDDPATGDFTKGSIFKNGVESVLVNDPRGVDLTRLFVQPAN